ncbi:MAG: hypothetical protein ABF326_11480, partial [Arenicellales bacterium]
GSNKRTIIIYENGYHMLNRDLQARKVLDDIADWIQKAISVEGTVTQHKKTVLDEQPNVSVKLSNFCKTTLD